MSVPRPACQEEEEDAPLLLGAVDEEEEERRRLEESRRRRAEILAKYQQQQQQQGGSGQQQAAAANPATAGAPASGSQQPPAPLSQAPAAQQPTAAQQQQRVLATPVASGTETPEGNRTSSEDSQNAPGDPVMDIWGTRLVTAAGEAPAAAAAGGDGGEASSRLTDLAAEPNLQSERLKGQHVEPTAAGDMFADGEDDMFGEAEPAAITGGGGGAAPAGLLDAYDDAEGYYNFQVSCRAVWCEVGGWCW
jgi:hypothetical protein